MYTLWLLIVFCDFLIGVEIGGRPQHGDFPSYNERGLIMMKIVQLIMVKSTSFGSRSSHSGIIKNIGKRW